MKAKLSVPLCTSRKVSFQLDKILKEEIEIMKRANVITEVTEPTEFVNPIVIVKKQALQFVVIRKKS